MDSDFVIDVHGVTEGLPIALSKTSGLRFLEGRFAF
jgi:hypothetical protein